MTASSRRGCVQRAAWRAWRVAEVSPWAEVPPRFPRPGGGVLQPPRGALWSSWSTSTPTPCRQAWPPATGIRSLSTPSGVRSPATTTSSELAAAPEAGLLAAWRPAGTAQEPPYSVARLDPGSEWEVQVRAVSANGVGGAWHSFGSFSVDVDLEPPPAPSDPVVTSTMGTVTVTWDGKTFDDQDMPADFTHCEVEMLGVTGPIGTLERSSGGNQFVVTDLEAGEEYSFRLVALDRSYTVPDPSG